MKLKHNKLIKVLGTNCEECGADAREECKNPPKPHSFHMSRLNKALSKSKSKRIMFANCGRRIMPSDGSPINPDMGPGRFYQRLVRFRKYISEGLNLHAVDSNAPGDKYTHCNWGMCDNSAERHPDPNDHIWPEAFINDGRSAPRHSGPGMFCPMDRRDSRETLDPSGCFYRCRIFSPKKGDKPMSREYSLQLYDKEIMNRLPIGIKEDSEYHWDNRIDEREPEILKQIESQHTYGHTE